ncbi:MAG: RelB antitoxin [Candidatus Parcubacteria bacterium]|jgi:addiction module RelB/DinJ family antitoxin
MQIKTMMNIKIDKGLKKKAADLADAMGFNLSSVVSAMLRNFVTTQELTVSLAPQMTPYLEAAIREVMKEKKGDRSPKFKNSKEAAAWLDAQ